MDTSIRFYNTNSSLRSVRDTERKNRPTSPLTVDEESYAETANVGEEVVDTHPQLSVPALQEQVQKVDVADFEAIFLRFQGPITNFIYHLIGNREQAYDLAQDVFVKAYKALLGGTVVQPGALSAWLYRIAANTTTDTLRRRRLIAWLPLSLFNEDRGIGAGVLSDSGGAVSDGFSSNDEDSSGGRASNIAQCMSAAPTMADGLRAEWPTARSWSAYLSSCRPSMLSVYGYTKMMAYPVRRLQRY